MPLQGVATFASCGRTPTSPGLAGPGLLAGERDDQAVVLYGKGRRGYPPAERFLGREVERTAVNAGAPLRMRDPVYAEGGCMPPRQQAAVTRPACGPAR
jgi:hypothetical protein